MGSRTRPRTATPNDKARILELAASGAKPVDIASELGLSPLQVGGVMSSAMNRGQLERRPNPAVAMQPPAPPPNAAAAGPHGQSPSPDPPSPGVDAGFNFNRAAPSPAGGGFSYNGQTTRYLVERIVPRDGLLGVHPAPFGVEDLGKVYGEGSYLVTRQEPGRPSAAAEQIIGPSYGRPRCPRAAESAHDRGRQWDREEDGLRAGQPRAYGQYPGYPPGYPPGYDRGRGDGAGESATTEAIRQVGSLTQKVIDQSRADRTGPDNFLRDFLQQQQTQWEQRRKDEQDEWRRRMDADRAKHDQDMERIKTEAQARAALEGEQRKTLLDLEQKRLDVIREEFKAREGAVQKELELNRAEMQKLEEKTREEIDRMDDRVAAEIDSRSKALDKEHDLRLKALEAAGHFQEEILKLKGETAVRTEGELVVKTLEKVVGEVSKVVREAIELKKMEVMSPEAQAAAVAKGQVDGNILPPTDQQSGAARAQAVGDAGAVAGPAGEKGGQTSMDNLVQDFLSKPFFREVLKDWVRQVERGQDATAFATMYMEWLKDPEDHRGRKAAATFANYMSSRDWPEVLKALDPNLEPAQREALARKNAEEFYLTFRYLVCESFREYWEGFAHARRQTAQQPPPAPIVGDGRERAAAPAAAGK